MSHFTIHKSNGSKETYSTTLVSSLKAAKSSTIHTHYGKTRTISLLSLILSGLTGSYRNKTAKIFQPMKNSSLIWDLTAYHPFSFGPASCVRKKLTLLEQWAVACFLIQQFYVRAKEGFHMDSSLGEKEIEDCFVIKRPPLPIFMEVRQWLGSRFIMLCFV